MEQQEEASDRERLQVFFDSENVIDALEAGENIVPDDPGEAYLFGLIESVYSEQWETVYRELDRAESVLTETKSLGVVLGTATYRPVVPVQLFQKVLAIDPHCALYQDAQDRTPLHMVLSMLDRPDLVQLLLDAAPQSISMMNSEMLKPAEVLSQKIFMKEERLRYGPEFSRFEGSDHENTEVVLELEWECVRLLALAHANKGSDNKLPLVHACVAACAEIPLALIDRSIRRYRHQVRQPDAEGNLPLHYLALGPPSDEVEIILTELVKRFPGGARHRNHIGQCPFDIALQSGWHWNTGIQQLLGAYPGAVSNLTLSTHTLCAVLAILSERDQSSLLFELVRANPDLAYSTITNITPE